VLAADSTRIIMPNKMLKTSLLSMSLLIASQECLAWGQQGHRVTGQIAENYLTEKTKTQLAAIMGPESLAESSTYPDEMRSSPDIFWKKTASPFHYVTLQDGENYHHHDAPDEGDAVTALKMYTKVLQDKTSSKEQKQLAVRFIVHIIGDLHQPLHVGSKARDDQGGNKIKVKYFGRDSNLHRVWDSEIIDSQQLSFTEYTALLMRHIDDSEVKTWSTVDLGGWINESALLREKTYSAADELSYDYNFQHTPTVKVRLQQAGVRIGAYLNAVLAGESIKFPH
jgi:hypothetical protein